jgi:hypothetical protein
LIHLSAGFARALEEAGIDGLRRRGLTLCDRTKEGTPFAAARRRVIKALGKTRKKDIKLSSHAMKQWGRVEDEETAYLMFPFLMEGALAAAERVVNHLCESSPEYSSAMGWLEELWRLRMASRTEHLWGSYMILVCYADQLPEFVDYVRHKQLHLSLRFLLHRAAAEIQDAAASLVTGQRRHARRSRTRHSQDFRSVVWCGHPFQFTSNQAACIRVLWDAWEKGTPEVGDTTILDEAGCESTRLVDVFKHNAAWGSMIVDGSTKGSSQLQELEPPA